MEKKALIRSAMIIVAVVALVWGLHNWTLTQSLICDERVDNARERVKSLNLKLWCDGFLNDYRRDKKQRWYIRGLIVDNCPEQYFKDLKHLDKGETVIHFDE